MKKFTRNSCAAHVATSLTSGNCKMESLDNNFQSKRVAFTLAEVLITLAVIGVVAAMTLPVLIQKQQKMVWVNQLKANYSILNQGFKMMMLDEGVDSFLDSSFRSAISDSAPIYYDAYVNGNPFYDNFKKYFKYSVVSSKNLPTQKRIDGSDSDIGTEEFSVYVLQNGATFYFQLYPFDYKYKQEDCNNTQKVGGQMCAPIINIILDVNGNKGPNTWGRDIFKFTLADKGAVVPFAGRDTALMELGRYLPNMNSSELDANIDDIMQQYSTGFDDECGYYAHSNEIFDNYYSCAAYLIDYKNWVMDY